MRVTIEDVLDRLREVFSADMWRAKVDRVTAAVAGGTLALTSCS